MIDHIFGDLFISIYNLKILHKKSEDTNVIK
jgi:hypothetical protein